MADDPHPHPHPSDAIADYRFRNWGGTVEFRAAYLHRPATLDALRDVVRRAADERRTVRVVGAGHSWSDVARSDDHLVDLARFDAVEVVDRARGLVRVGGGARLRDVNAALDRAGLAMSNLGSISEQSVAGAISTGTHGSGARFGVLATQVVAMQLLTADGELRALSPASDPELFAAARVGLGAFGVITEVTLACEPAFNLAETTTALPFETAFGPATLETVRANDHAQYYWLPHTNRALLFERNRTSAVPAVSSPPGPPAANARETLAFRALLAVGAAVPALLPGLNRLGSRALYKPAHRVDRSDAVLNVPLPPVYHESEYALPIERTVDAFHRVRALVDDAGLRANFPVVARFARGDDLWMSPAYGRDTCFVGLLTTTRGAGAERGFRLFEALMRDLGGRPHWGKLFHATPTQLRAMYPETYARFAALRERTDPAGVFRTPFVARHFG
jgi:FAD-linked oxidoreductase